MRAMLTDDALADDGTNPSAGRPVLPHLAQLYGSAGRHNRLCYTHIDRAYQQIMRAVIQHAREAQQGG